MQAKTEAHHIQEEVNSMSGSSWAGFWAFRQTCFLSLLISGLLLTGITAAHSNELKIYTGAGAYKISQDKAFFEPFQQETGTKIDAESKTDLLDLLKQWKSRSSAEADVINLTSFQAETACNEGLLTTLTQDNIEPGPRGLSIERDFLANSLMDCAVPTTAWSALMVIKPRAFPTKKPRSWKDFFDIKSFEGKRSLKKSARFTMEMALLASGVKDNDVYQVLGTLAGQKRAFRQLDKIKEQIVWWADGREAIDNLNKDEVVMGMANNGRLFHAIIADGLDVQLIWQGQIYDYDYWGVPLNSQRQVEALEFVKFATAPERLAAQSNWAPYGPMRSSSLRFVKEHEIGKMHMGPYLTTTRTHFKRALKFNEGFWRSEAGKELSRRFEAWLDGDITWPEDDE